MMRNNPKLDIVNVAVHTKFVLKILSGNEILLSIKGHNSVKILQKMKGNNPKLDLVNVDVHTKFGQILSIFPKILSGNNILTSIKGRNSIKILQKIKGNNPNLDLVNVDKHTKFGQILTICSEDIEQKQNSYINQGP